MTAFKKTDVLVSKNVHMSLSAKYSYAENAKIIHTIIKCTLPVFRTLLKLPYDLKFRIAPIKARGVRGQYYSKIKLVVLDARLPWEDAMTTLAHELVHAEQYHEGRLKSTKEHKQFIWNSKRHNLGYTYKSYRDMPWEVEAFDRQQILADQVNDILEKKNEESRSKRSQNA